MKTKRRNHSQRNETPHAWLHGIVTLSAAFTVLLLAVSAAGWADAFYTVAASQNTAVVLTKDEAVSNLEESPVYVSSTAASWDVTLAAGQNVTIRHGDDVQSATSRQERLSILLERLHIEVAPEELVSVNLSAPGGPEITISKELTYYETETETSPHDVVLVPTNQLPKGQERVAEAGQDGVHTSIYRVVWADGAIVSRELVEEVSNSAVTEVIEYGTAPVGAETVAYANPNPNADSVDFFSEVIGDVDGANGADFFSEVMQSGPAYQESAAVFGPTHPDMAAEEAEQFAQAVEAEQAEEITGTFDVPTEAQLFAAPTEPEKEPTPTPTPIPTPTPAFKENNNSNLPMDELVDVRKNKDGSGVLVFKSGRTARYKYIKNMTATAYNKDEPKVGTITATGTTVHKGVVAVDKKVIPLGTKMYIVANGYEYGYSVAEDTGVFGNIVDLYFESYKGMINFGRRPCVCYILE